MTNAGIKLFLFRIACLFCTGILLGATSCKKKQISFFDPELDTIVKTGDRLYISGHKARALRYVDSSLKPFFDNKLLAKYKAVKFVADYYYYEHKMDSSNFYADSLLYIMEVLKLNEQMPLEYVRLLNNFGDFYYTQNDLRKAFSFYTRSRVANFENHDPAISADQDHHLGILSYKQERYREALGFFKESFDEASKLAMCAHTFARQQELYNDIALCYTRLNQLDSAALYYDKALDFLANPLPQMVDSLGGFVEVARGVVLGNLAKVYIAQSKNDTAKWLLGRSIAINSRPGYENRDAMLARLEYINLHLKLNELQEAKKHLDTLAVELLRTPDLTIKMRSHFALFKYYSAVCDHALADEHVNKYFSTKDSVDQNEQKFKESDFVGILNSLETQYDLKLLKKDNEVKRLSLSVTIAFSVLVLVILYMIFGNYKRSRKNVQELTELNRQISNQKEQLLATAEQLQQSLRDKDRILHTVAHDLRNPISGVVMLSSHVLDKQEQPEEKDQLQLIINAAQSSLMLINELMEYNDGQPDKTEFKENTDLNELAVRSTNMLAFLAERKMQKISVHPAPQPVNVYVVKDKIERIISNLATNALKFSKYNDVVDVWVRVAGDKAIIEVHDTGIGIPAEIRSAIFEPFTQAKRRGTAGEKAYGLGLSICRQIVSQHNGRIWVASEEGHGSVFFVELPIYTS